ncbi:MAG: acylneuraminate cytidylyltransferase family protein [Candidatus Latescibacteria bacterium]|nr:acylneuraminate cytidylyltransferase family protein [Candidatus Latescibacterota bacterium]
MNQPAAIALIPARQGSKRVPNKNVRPLGGHPLLAYTIRAAIESGVFSEVMVSTDSEMYADIARHYGASVPFLRPEEFSGDASPDIEWVEYTLSELRTGGKDYECFSILRPTSPFRLPETIRRAWNEFLAAGEIDSLRAVEKCKQHPGKMWVVRNNRLFPLLPFTLNGQPWHSNQTQFLPEVYVQNASLEVAYTRVIFSGRTIAGEVVLPFFTQGYEGFDINRPEEWQRVEELITSGEALLPQIAISPFTAFQ